MNERMIVERDPGLGAIFDIVVGTLQATSLHDLFYHETYKVHVFIVPFESRPLNTQENPTDKSQSGFLADRIKQFSSGGPDGIRTRDLLRDRETC